MRKKIYPGLKSIATLLSCTLALACNNSNPTDHENKKTETAVEVSDADKPVQHTWVVSEHAINDVPVTSKGVNTTLGESDEMQKTVEESNAKSDLDRKVEVDDRYEVVTHEELKQGLSRNDYVMLSEVTVTETVIPLGTTETIVSYSSKGEAKDTLQVVHGADGEIQHIVFNHKHHKDEYDVETGMTGKEVQSLRKDMKRMQKHGKVFMYSETSNIMYVMVASNAEGDEYTNQSSGGQTLAEADVDEMKVQAIVWKDKKYHQPE